MSTPAVPGGDFADCASDPYAKLLGAMLAVALLDARRGDATARRWLLRRGVHYAGVVGLERPELIVERMDR